MRGLRLFFLGTVCLFVLAACGGPPATPATQPVPQGQVAVRVNPDYDPGTGAEPYAEVKTEGEMYTTATFRV